MSRSVQKVQGESLVDDEKNVGVGFRAWGLGFKIQGLGCRVWGSGFKVSDIGCRVRGLGCRV